MRIRCRILGVFHGVIHSGEKRCRSRVVFCRFNWTEQWERSTKPERERLQEKVAVWNDGRRNDPPRANGTRNKSRGRVAGMEDRSRDVDRAITGSSRSSRKW